MKLEKAIEILTFWHDNASPTLKGDYKDALNLGIEALKLVKEGREKGTIIPTYLLPGETI
uniref:Uncharacterized protein n=1 Tax=viral metagenome TaxID=1070528 RepID=A0A6H2A0Y8_9ZZZZ